MDGTGAGVEMVWMRVVPVHAHAEAGPFGYAVVAAAGGALHPAVATAHADGAGRSARRTAREAAMRAAIERSAAKIAAALGARAAVRVALVVDRSRVLADTEERVAVAALREAGLKAEASGIGTSEPERVREQVAGIEVDAVRDLLWKAEHAGEDAALGGLPGGGSADPYGYETDADADGIPPHEEDGEMLIEDRFAIGAGPDPLASAVVGDLPLARDREPGQGVPVEEDVGAMFDHLAIVYGRHLVAARAPGGEDPYRAPLAHLARRCRNALARGAGGGRPLEGWEQAMAQALAMAVDRDGVDDRDETPMSALRAALGEPRGAGSRLAAEPWPVVAAAPRRSGCFGEWLRFRDFRDGILDGTPLYALDAGRAESAACATEAVRRLAWRALADCPVRDGLGDLAEALVDDALDHQAVDRQAVRERIAVGSRLMAALEREGRARLDLIEAIFDDSPGE